MYQDAEKNVKQGLVQILAYTWFFVAAILNAKDLISFLSIANLKDKNINDRVFYILEECKQELKIIKDIEIVFQDRIKTPSLYGIKNVKILFTDEILNLSDDEIKHVIMHELNHYKYFHNIFYLFSTLIANLHWFNPCIRYAINLIKEDLEIVTDNRVLNSGIKTNEYCKTILKVVLMANVQSKLMPTICSGKNEIERRIINMKDKKEYSKFSVFILILALLVISLISVSLASEKVEEQETKIKEITTLNNEVESEDIEYVLPVNSGKVSAIFGKRVHPITNQEKFHTGVDIALDKGEDVYSIAKGKVIYADFSGNDGNMVKVEHEDKSVSCYKHGLEILVEVGDEVEAGEKIMLVGATGAATGAHLHIEVLNSEGEYININSMFEEL